MTEQEIYTELTAIFRVALDDETIVLTPDTTADDIENWDSMNHILIVVAIEGQLGIKFQAAEMEELRNIGELVALVKKKLSAAKG